MKFIENIQKIAQKYSKKFKNAKIRADRAPDEAFQALRRERNVRKSFLVQHETRYKLPDSTFRHNVISVADGKIRKVNKNIANAATARHPSSADTARAAARS